MRLLLSILLVGCTRAPSPASDLSGPPADLSTAGARMGFFITSEGGSGNLGGLAGADARCQRLAEAAGTMGRTWRAYLSAAGGGATVNARDRIGKGPWHSARGVKIADDVDGLHDQDPASTRNNLRGDTALDERGRVVPGRAIGRDGGAGNEHDIITGSDAMGRLAKDGACAAGCTCEDWTSEGAGRARCGHFDRVGGGAAPTSWNAAHETAGCSEANFIGTGGKGRIYCFAAD